MQQFRDVGNQNPVVEVMEQYKVVTVNSKMELNWLLYRLDKAR